MKFRKWKLGLVVAAITGAATVFAVGLIVPSMTTRQAMLVLLGSIAKDVILFCAQHPWSDVEFEAEVERRAQQCRCQSVTPCNPEVKNTTDA